MNPLLLRRRGVIASTPSGVELGSFVDEMLADGPVAWWRLGEPDRTVDPVDEIGGLTGSYFSGTSGVIDPGVPGAIIGDPDTAVNFDGSDDRVSLPNHNGLISGAFTFELWFKPDSLVTASSTLRAIARLGSGSDILLGNRGAGKVLSFESGTFAIWSTEEIAATWHHLAVVWDGTEYTLYLDGAELATTTNGATPAVPAFTSIYLGGTGSSGTSSDWLGDLDEVAFHDTALDAARIAARWASAGYT